jgi:hypothetical protein
MANRRRKRARRRGAVAIVTGALGALAIGSAPAAWAQPALSVAVRSASVEQVSASGSSCAWTVTATIAATNLSGGPVTFDAVHPRVSWRGPDSTSGVVPRSAVTVLDDGGLRAGSGVPGATASGPGAVVTWTGYEVRVPMPCDVTSADLAVVVSSSGQSWSGDAPFVERSVTTPLGATGALTITAVLAAVAAAFLRRSSRRRVRPAAGGQSAGDG